MDGWVEYGTQYAYLHACFFFPEFSLPLLVHYYRKCKSFGNVNIYFELRVALARVIRIKWILIDNKYFMWNVTELRYLENYLTFRIWSAMLAVMVEMKCQYVRYVSSCERRNVFWPNVMVMQTVTFMPIASINVALLDIYINVFEEEKLTE